MLCDFAHSFPERLADFLERDKGLKRNFREETATDLLVAGLVGLESFGITVDLPDEVITGADMDWIYAAPHDVGGGTYLRLLIQAKRAKFTKLKHGGYWYYNSLDHGTPPGEQANTLINHASTSPDGMATLPLYFFYHPRSAITPPISDLPNISGVNVVFAKEIASVVSGGCGKQQKKIERWRPKFFPLSELLCWPLTTETPPSSPEPNIEFISRGSFSPAFTADVAWHPDFVSDRLNDLRSGATGVEFEESIISPTSEISDVIRRAIEGRSIPTDRKKLRRPRVIFRTRLTRETPGYAEDREALKSRQKQRRLLDE